MSCLRGWKISAKSVNGNPLNVTEVKEIREFASKNFCQIEILDQYYGNLIADFDTESNLGYDYVISELITLSKSFPRYIFQAETYCFDYQDVHAINACNGETEVLEVIYKEAKRVVF